MNKLAPILCFLALAACSAKEGRILDDPRFLLNGSDDYVVSIKASKYADGSDMPCGYAPIPAYGNLREKAPLQYASEYRLSVFFQKDDYSLKAAIGYLNQEGNPLTKKEEAPSHWTRVGESLFDHYGISQEVALSSSTFFTPKTGIPEDAYFLVIGFRFSSPSYGEGQVAFYARLSNE